MYFYVTLCRFSVQTYFITHKSLSGHAKTSVTSPWLKIVESHTTGKFTRQHGINTINFLMKFRGVIDIHYQCKNIHYFDITVDFSACIFERETIARLSY